MSEIGEDVLYERVYFSDTTAEFDALHRSASLQDSSTCTETFNWWLLLLYIIVILLILILISLIVYSCWIYRKKRRYFIPLSTDEGEGVTTRSANTAVFSLNTYDRIQHGHFSVC